MLASISAIPAHNSRAAIIGDGIGNKSVAACDFSSDLGWYEEVLTSNSYESELLNAAQSILSERLGGMSYQVKPYDPDYALSLGDSIETPFGVQRIKALSFSSGSVDIQAGQRLPDAEDVLKAKNDLAKISRTSKSVWSLNVNEDLTDLFPILVKFEVPAALDPTLDYEFKLRFSVNFYQSTLIYSETYDGHNHNGLTGGATLTHSDVGDHSGYVHVAQAGAHVHDTTITVERADEEGVVGVLRSDTFYDFEVAPVGYGTERLYFAPFATRFLGDGTEGGHTHTSDGLDAAGTHTHPATGTFETAPGANPDWHPISPIMEFYDADAIDPMDPYTNDDEPLPYQNGDMRSVSVSTSDHVHLCACTAVEDQGEHNHDGHPTMNRAGSLDHPSDAYSIGTDTTPDETIHNLIEIADSGEPFLVAVQVNNVDVDGSPWEDVRIGDSYTEIDITDLITMSGYNYLYFFLDPFTGSDPTLASIDCQIVASFYT